MNRVARFAIRAVLWIGVGVGASVLIASGALAQTMTPPPGMMLVDCPVRPAPWQAPGIQGHPGFDLSIDPSSALAMARGVPEQCIAYPGGSQQVYHQIIGLQVYIPRWGNDGGSQYGALAKAVAIRDLNGGSASLYDAEFWGLGQLENCRVYTSDDGRWCYSVRGGLDLTTCDVVDRLEWRRWAKLVHERDLVGCLGRLWERGGRLGMPVTPTSIPATATALPVLQASSQPASQLELTPTKVPTPTVNPVEARLTELERRQAEDRSLLQQIWEAIKP